MEEQDHTKRDSASRTLRYLWPTPTGLVLILTGYLVFQVLGQRAFLNTHFFLEIGVMITMFASVMYAIRLSGKGRRLAPRWVFYVNLCFGPLIFGYFLIAGILTNLS